MANINIGAAGNTVNTLASLPIDKKVIYATLSASTNLSVSSAMSVGQTITIVIKPTATFEQILPTTGGWQTSQNPMMKMYNGVIKTIEIDCPSSGTYVINYD